MRKKEDVEANVKEFEKEYQWLKENFAMDPELELTELCNGFWHGPEVVLAMRKFAYDEQHEEPENGK
jgi:hypothetical protein